MKTRKFGYYEACARQYTHHVSRCKMSGYHKCWRENVWQPASCEEETT